MTSVVGTQDVSLTAWGFGLTGLSATIYARARTGFGSEAVWPGSGDRFDAMLAYAQLVRSGWTVRAGRQEVRSGLGFSSFDGGSIAWRSSKLRLQGYGGRSLARGLRDPANDALRGLEDFLPDQGIYLWGGAAAMRLATASGALRYQREILADRSGLASERASLDLSTALPGVRLEGSLDWDFGRGQPGKGHVTALVPISAGTWTVSGSLRRYVPYFSLSTIWGFFEPVAYHEAEARVAWSPSREVGAWLTGGRRSYGDTRTVTVLRSLEDTGWRGEVGAAWSLRPSWRIDGRYELEWVPGGFLSSAETTVAWMPEARYSLAVTGMSLQQIEQFRLGDGRAHGVGLSGQMQLGQRMNLSGGGSVLRHTMDGGDGPWNQSRAWTSLRVRVGSDPGLANRRGGVSR
ncbi:MAG: hypothetical protein R3253_00765 [Longimicrobiales bacterium]|nr:hypothetical protein [Longimicrobiales bacterium]